MGYTYVQHHEICCTPYIKLGAAGYFLHVCTAVGTSTSILVQYWGEHSKFFIIGDSLNILFWLRWSLMLRHGGYYYFSCCTAHHQFPFLLSTLPLSRNWFNYTHLFHYSAHSMLELFVTNREIMSLS